LPERKLAACRRKEGKKKGEKVSDPADADLVRGKKGGRDLQRVREEAGSLAWTGGKKEEKKAMPVDRGEKGSNHLNAAISMLSNVKGPTRLAIGRGKGGKGFESRPAWPLPSSARKEKKEKGGAHAGTERGRKPRRPARSLAYFYGEGREGKRRYFPN